MVSFQIDQLYGWITAFLWPFFRILSLIGAAPVLGESSIPVRVKIGFAAVVTVAVAPSIGPLPNIPPASYEGLWITLQQVLIGTSLGLTMRIVFAAAQTAGDFIGLQMGLSFASFFDPATGANTAVLARIMNIMAILLFITLNGHLLLLAGVLRTFETLPISAHALNPDGFGMLFEWSSQVLLGGMLLALPFIIILLTINLALGILNRTAQQLSVFAVGFPITLVTGLILLMVILPQTLPFLGQMFEMGYAAMDRLTQALAGG